MKIAYKDGTTHIVMPPLEFMQRLAALPTRPRLHLIPFDGLRAGRTHLGLPTRAPPRAPARR
ncbi:MAG: IS91 family transposase, partial [Candidatus Binatia bacterium]|nr:IS91 family transposase [Candidatus Binatia bacterium]